MTVMATDLRFCPHCGAPVTAQDQQCPQCQTDLRPFRSSTTAQTPKKAPKMNLNALMANPYKEGLKRLQDREGTPNKPTHRWHWPWSKE
ncbi:hypothetical protein FD37_GL000330 [Levilactobacillus spicheri DSM 15429]|uniref:Putative zinc-ribbon domain-containing protein n=2 Tax=Levilactobacillus spicheri TaxID=216463 RepID=A0A0R1QXC5_9LACO|nr:hypothetical protein FD37_GL000330 [Levilactobacillus spicheri DSM 15429]